MRVSFARLLFSLFYFVTDISSLSRPSFLSSGNLVQSSNEDWTIVFELCEQVSRSEAAAKDASRGIRRAFKYAQATPQLMAARLWAVMLRNMNIASTPDSHSHSHSQPLFLRETGGRKFMDAVEDVVTNPKTEPVVKERILDVLGSAVFEYTGKDRKHPYAVMWRKLKAKTAPDQVSDCFFFFSF